VSLGLNVDAGEYPDEPEALFVLAHLVNIACGGHAGDGASMRRVLGFCKRYGTRAGAHPSYADREGFGRRPQAGPPEALAQLVADQCARLRGHAEALGVPLGHVKPHGALYHAANADPALARAVIEGSVRALGASVMVVGPPRGALATTAAEMHVEFAREGFADRAMRPDGTLVPRTEPGALVTDPEKAAAQAKRLLESGEVDTVCVHADTPSALRVAHAVRDAIDGEVRA
jgi:UPF0271 protein